ncbi:hypothetical protein [Pseudogulbenkiania ferrooxidans]|uniref:hypothetical protein n=1 Tax=Pseudogulbenkiania ferrooxidans TaxID=549169 RepID=UPI001268EE5A|nr:hypothetical protein [Pseudogulbenkiania ferrooxidans]
MRNLTVEEIKKISGAGGAPGAAVGAAVGAVVGAGAGAVQSLMSSAADPNRSVSDGLYDLGKSMAVNGAIGAGTGAYYGSGVGVVVAIGTAGAAAAASGGLDIIWNNNDAKDLKDQVR